MWQGRHHGHGCVPTERLIYCTLTVGPLCVPQCGKPDVYSVVVGGGDYILLLSGKKYLIKYYLFEVILQMRKHFINKTHFLIDTKQRLKI